MLRYQIAQFQNKRAQGRLLLFDIRYSNIV
jgi:hypothetical protein